MTISTQLGDRQKSLALLQLGNKILPTNALVRNRYALSLTPRWGGSYQALDAFIAKTKGDAVPRSVIRQLEAIELQDKGQTFAEQGMHDAAITHFRKALELSEKVGGTFAMDHLPWARRYACSELRELAACQ